VNLNKKVNRSGFVKVVNKVTKDKKLRVNFLKACLLQHQAAAVPLSFLLSELLLAVHFHVVHLKH